MDRTKNTQQHISVVLYLGRFAAGKGTQAEKMAGALKTTANGMGDILRHKIDTDSKFAQTYEPLIKAGKPISPEVTARIFSDYLSEKISKHDHVVFDGYPRLVADVYHLGRLLPELGVRALVINLNASFNTCVERCQLRYKLALLGYGKVRADDANKASFIERNLQYEPNVNEINREALTNKAAFLDFINVNGEQSENKVLLDTLVQSSPYLTL